MISATFVQFQTSTSFPKCSKKSLIPTFVLTCPLTLCLLFNLLTGSFILLNWNYFFKNSQWARPWNGSWWGHLHSSWLTRSLRYCRSYILLTRLHKWFGFDGLSLNWSSSHLWSRARSDSLNQWFHLRILYSFLWCTPKFRSWPTTTVPLGSMISRNSLIYVQCIICTLMIPSCTSLSFQLILFYIFIETLTTIFTVILSWMNLN